MSMHGASLDHRLWLLLAVLTHAAVGYALAAASTRRQPAAGAVGGVLPDVDLLFDPAWSFPFVHRGVTHAPAFAAVVAGGVYALAPVRWAWRGVTLGVLSHVVLDAFSATGVPLFYPASTVRYGVDASVHAVDRTAVLWVLAAALLLLARRRD